MSKPTPGRSPRYGRERVSFIKTELELGLAFSTIALRSAVRATSARNTANARAAFDAARRHVGKVQLTAEDLKEINHGFEKLRANLDQLSAFLDVSAASSARLGPAERW